MSILAFGVGLVLLGALGGCTNGTTPEAQNAYQQVTGGGIEDDQQHWDALYKTTQYVYGKEPSVFLKEHLALLPVGNALDIAMGEGRNAVFLAKKGFIVEGVDLSDVALRKARILARENRVSIKTINADLNSYQIKPDSYDVIVNILYLQRNLIPQIKRGLRKGGVIVFENYTVDQLANAGGQQLRRDYLLEKGELKEAFKEFKILVYRETNDGKDAVAALIAKKP